QPTHVGIDIVVASIGLQTNGSKPYGPHTADKFEEEYGEHFRKEEEEELFSDEELGQMNPYKLVKGSKFV
ncbi:hypothetical protein MKX01_035986, partial [Papaver californicum]